MYQIHAGDRGRDGEIYCREQAREIMRAGKAEASRAGQRALHWGRMSTIV